MGTAKELKCTSGQVAVQDIMDATNANASDILLLETDVSSNKARLDSSELTDIDHNQRLVDLENNTVSDGDISDLEARVALNETGISDNTDRIVANENNIIVNTNDITNIDTRLTVNETLSLQNQSDIAIRNNAQDLTLTDHETRILALEAASVFQGALLRHRVVAGTGGGSSSITWAARIINEVSYNTITGAIPGATSISLPEGIYKVESMAIVEGSAHQSAIFIGATGGVPSILGSLASGSGMSVIHGDVVVPAGGDSLSIGTIVETPVLNTGFGAPSPFTEDSIFVILKIEKVG